MLFGGSSSPPLGATNTTQNRQQRLPELQESAVISLIRSEQSERGTSFKRQLTLRSWHSYKNDQLFKFLGAFRLLGYLDPYHEQFGQQQLRPRWLDIYEPQLVSLIFNSVDDSLSYTLDGCHDLVSVISALYSRCEFGIEQENPLISQANITFNACMMLHNARSMPEKMEGVITRWVRGLQHVGGTISEGPVIGLLMFFTHKALRNVFFEVLWRGSQYGLMDVIRELCDAADALAQRANGGGNAAPGLNMALGAFEDKKHFCRYCKTRGHLIETCSKLERKKARERSGLGGQQEGQKGRHHFEELGVAFSAKQKDGI